MAEILKSEKVKQIYSVHFLHMPAHMRNKVCNEYYTKSKSYVYPAYSKLSLLSAGRKTLHGHWLLWVKAYQRLREMLFNHNKSVQAAARKRFTEFVDLVMSSSLASFDKITSLPMDSLQVSHSCGMKESALSSA